MAAPSSIFSRANKPRDARLLVSSIGLAIIASFIATSAVSSASAAPVMSGPVNLKSAATYAVLAASEVTNTGPSELRGDLGLSPGTSISGFGGAGNGTVVTGTTHQTDAQAVQAQKDAAEAFGVAASLLPQASGLEQLSGLILTPGVYSGDALNLADNGVITLVGDANSYWVFQAASSLTIGSGTTVAFTGTANSCNVFWQVGSSASIGTTADFVGTVIARQSITLTNDADVQGRLLALNAAVTLINNDITAPVDCPTYESVPATITSDEPEDATVGTPYEHDVDATGSPEARYAVTDGTLPAGLTLDSDTGVISGTPTTAGSSTFTISASNGTSDADDTAEYSIVVAAAAALAASGSSSDLVAPLLGSLVALMLGVGLISGVRRVRER